MNWRNHDGSVNLFCLNSAGDSLIHVAVGRKNILEINFLLDEGLDINRQGDFLCTPLHLAARLDSDEIYDFLISKGADEGLVNSLGETPKDRWLRNHRLRGQASGYQSQITDIDDDFQNW